MHPNYSIAKKHAEEIRALACDLIRKIDDADDGRAGDHEIEGIAREIDRHTQAIGETLGTRTAPATDDQPAAENSPEMIAAMIEIAEDDLRIAIKRRDEAVAAETAARETNRAAAQAIEKTRRAHADAQAATNKAEDKVQQARTIHAQIKDRAKNTTR